MADWRNNAFCDVCRTVTCCQRPCLKLKKYLEKEEEEEEGN